MKRLLFLLTLVILAWMPLYSQTVLFYEDFENVTASGMTSSGVPGWGNSSILFAGGLKSDSATCFNAGDSSVLMVTNAFNTSAFGYVMLEFDHICKIEFYDAAYIEVSANNGSSWIRLTGSQYLGSGQFASSGDKFNSTSYVDWLPGNPTPPSNTWWKHEYFDISSVASNASAVLVRFVLKDENNLSVFDNYAWFLDNVKITGALSELTPPVIQMIPPVQQGMVFSLGPFQVQAQLSDTSGIDTAYVVYQINSLPWDTVPMQWTSGNGYEAYLPVVSDLDTIHYSVVAVDASLSHNVAVYPSVGHLSFVASSGLYTPYFNDFEMADSLWIASSNSSSTRWEYGMPAYGALTGAFSGNNAWTINKDSLYGNGGEAYLTSPYFNLSQMENLILSFRQNRSTEAQWDGFHLEYTLDGLQWNLLGGLNDPLGENWYTDTIFATGGSPAWEGASSGWIRSSYRIDVLNHVPMVRFRFVFTSDTYVVYEGVSIDDFALYTRPDNDVSVVRMVSPQTGCDPGLEPVSVVVGNEGLDTLYSVPLAYWVSGAPSPVSETFIDTLYPDSSSVYQFYVPLDMQVSGSDSVFVIDVYSQLPGDTMNDNDTLRLTVIAGAIPPDPIPLHQTIPYATSTQVTATSPDTLFWYRDSIGADLLYIGDTLSTPVLYDSATYWVESRVGVGALRFTELTLESAGAGATNPYPSYIPPSTQWDGLEISNLGASAVDLSGYVFHAVGYRTIDYPLPMGISLMPGESMVLSVYAFPAVTSDTASRFFVADSLPVYSTSQLGFWLEKPDGSVEDAFAVNGYTFPAGSPVTSNLWSGSISSASGRAGVIRISDIYHGPADWMLSDVPSPVQTIGSYNPQLDPVLSLGCPGIRIPLHVYMASYPLHDVGVVSILTPVSDTSLTTSEPISVVVKNFGLQALNNIQVSCSLDGASPVTETIGASLAAGDTMHYTFLNTLDLSSYQLYKLKVWASLTQDTVPLNDTSYAEIIHSLPPYCLSSANYTSLGDIGQVTFGSLDHLSSAGSKMYSDFTHLPPESFIQGLAYPVTVRMQPQSTYNYVFGIKVFIDLDGDGAFDPVNELICSGLTSSTQTDVQGIYSFPTGLNPGIKRMRVVMTYTSNLNNVEPCGTYNYGETEDYTILLLPPLPYDASVSTIAQINPPLIIGSVLPVVAVVRNLGSDTLDQIPVVYEISGNAPVVEMVSAPLAPGASTSYTFSSPVVVPGGLFHLRVYSDLMNDGYRANDTVSIALLGEREHTALYFDDFEHDDPNGWGNEMPALWQLGKPMANVINSAYSPTRAWATRLTSNYLSNIQKGIMTPEISMPDLDGLTLRFWHWYETESGFDGGTIKYSDNGGVTYLTLGTLGDPLGVNWYNSYSSGKFSFSGSSGGWVYSSYDISAFKNHPTPVSFKFDFFSNASVSFNGWAIDDFMISVDKDSIDGGVSQISYPINTIAQGMPFTPRLRVHNHGLTPLTNIQVAITVNGGQEFTDQINTTLLPGQVITHIYSYPLTSPGYMEMTAYVKVPGDKYRFNDTAYRQVGNIGMDHMGGIQEISISPNPANDRVLVSIKALKAESVRLSLADLNGRIVTSQWISLNLGLNSESLDLSSVLPGVYFLTIRNSVGVLKKKLVVY